MKKKFPLTLTLLLISGLYNSLTAQTPFYSDYLIKYDLATHKTDKAIPFDHSFTLVIDKLSTKNLIAVHAYETVFINGQRVKKTNTYRECTTNASTTKAVVDMILNTNPYSDTLQIFFPPLRPNVDFDIQAIYNINDDCRLKLMKVNSLLSQTSASANAAYTEFSNCMIDKLAGTTYLGVLFPGYQAFYTASLAAHYTDISTAANYTVGDSLTLSQIQAIDIATTSLADFKDGNLLVESFHRNLFHDIYLGTRDISKVFLSDNETLTNLHPGHTRLQNLESNLKYFDSVLKRIDRAISKGNAMVLVGGVNVNLTTVRTAITDIQTDLRTNYEYLKVRMKAINEAIDANQGMKQGVYLAGNTVSSDLKSAGGNVLFLDAGFTNIVAPSIRNKPVYIPKLYWGVSIYFRPIDKNTRRSRFPSTFDPALNTGCRIDSTTGLPVYGPDYGIAAKRSILQHLCLNLGFTFGAMGNKDFDNFYNNTTLLIGPGYRFARAFKFSMGAALLKRTSKNPVISEKKVVCGAYASLSVDIDFIQGLKDITSILFK